MKKFAYFFYPDLANGFPDVPAAWDGTAWGTYYIIGDKRVKKKANEQSYIGPRTNQKK